MTDSSAEAYKARVFNDVFQALLTAGDGNMINLPLAIDAMSNAMVTFVVSLGMMTSMEEPETMAGKIDDMASQVAACLADLAVKARAGELRPPILTRPALRLVD